MRQRPWALVVLAAMHFLAPFGNIVLNAIFAGENVLAYFVYAMSPEYLSQNWMMMLAPLVAGFAIYVCKKWSFFVYMLAITLMFILSYTGYLSKDGAISIVPVVLVYFFNIAVVSYFLLPAVRSIYFDRRMRWWENQPRYKCDFTASYKTAQGIVEGKVENISLDGLFFKADEMPKDKSVISISLPILKDEPLSIDGMAIIHNRADAVGFGVKFNHTEQSKAKLKNLVKDLEAQGMRISRSSSRPEDSFSYWLRTLLTTGKGLVPKKNGKS